MKKLQITIITLILASFGFAQNTDPQGITTSAQQAAQETQANQQQIQNLQTELQHAQLQLEIQETMLQSLIRSNLTTQANNQRNKIADTQQQITNLQTQINSLNTPPGMTTEQYEQQVQANQVATYKQQCRQILQKINLLQSEYRKTQDQAMRNTYRRRIQVLNNELRSLNPQQQTPQQQTPQQQAENQISNTLSLNQIDPTKPDNVLKFSNQIITSLAQKNNSGYLSIQQNFNNLKNGNTSQLTFENQTYNMSTLSDTDKKLILNLYALNAICNSNTIMNDSNYRQHIYNVMLTVRAAISLNTPTLSQTNHNTLIENLINIQNRPQTTSAITTSLSTQVENLPEDDTLLDIASITSLTKLFSSAESSTQTMEILTIEDDLRTLFADITADLNNNKISKKTKAALKQLKKDLKNHHNAGTSN